MVRLLGVLSALVLVFGLAFGNVEPDPQGDAFGFGCKLVDSSTYDTPADMLMYLTERDGHFQNTVDSWFDSVADLIAQKCGPANL